MTPNWMGVTAALATFVGVWLGHVSVRYVEYHAAALTWPRLAYVTLGLACEAAALFSSNPYAAAALGIMGMTLLFDALELGRQFRRVARGHAPANPRNPRHAPLLAAGRATTTDWLARAPTGQPINSPDATP